HAFANAQLELGCGFGSRDFHDGCGIPLVLAIALRKTVDARDGLRSERQSQNGRNEERRRPGLRWLICSRLAFRLHLGSDPPWTSRGQHPFRLDDWVSRVARIRRYRATDRCAVHEAEHEALRD